jgi:hypothetical protein
MATAPAPVPTPAAAVADPPAVLVTELPEVTVVVERADFEEGPLPAAGAAPSTLPAPRSPPASAGPERSRDLVRRLLGLQEAMRE